MGEDQTVGRIELPGGFFQAQQRITAPAAGDVVRNNVTEGTFVTVGTQLAIAYDLSVVHVTARVDETDIDAVHIGQQVDVTVDAYPDSQLAGRVVGVRMGVAGVLAGVPVDDRTVPFERFTQVIPVEIGITDRRGLPLVPGMSATVRIHR